MPIRRPSTPTAEDPKAGRGLRPLRPAFLAPAQKATVRCEPDADRQRLWLCIHLPALAADALKGSAVSRPLIVYEEVGGRAVIQACNEAALDCGIHPGTTVAAALALCEKVIASPRNPIAEREMMDRLAGWALRFSSEVSLYAADAIVLEIGGSLRLFGGIEPLIDQLVSGIEGRALRHALAAAPAPRAAWWLARAGGQTIVTAAGQLAGALRGLPIERVTADRKQRLRLERSGIRTLGDLMRLPRAGLARRFGADLIGQLDRALARETEPLVLFQPPERFTASHAFYAPTSDLHRIGAAARNLLRQLEAFLIRRQAAIRQFHCLLAHEKQPATVIEVGCRRSMYRAEALACLLDTHLERCRLGAEAAAVTIRAWRIERFIPRQTDLFESTSEDEQSWQQLLARMEARLGRAAVRQLCVQADHRPEKAGGYGSPRQGAAPSGISRRPLWLLTDAEPLPLLRRRPCWQGPLQIESAVERIEQGWWSDKDIRRDYRIAHGAGGATLWLYRDRRRHGWFLHGLFG